MNIKIKFKGRFFELDAHRVGFFGKFSGLMFKTRETENLLFSFNREGRVGIHSYFVFFPFLAVWLDENNRVLETRVVSPFTTLVKPKNNFKKLLELPFNKDNNEIIDFLVGRKRFK